VGEDHEIHSTSASLSNGEGERIQIRAPSWYILRAQNSCDSVASGRRIGVNLRGELKLMVKFLLWCVLLFLCWPLALLALVLYPVVWILTLPFRLVGIAVGGVFDLLRALITLPARILSGPRHA
jgi:hypothetical protein